MRMMDLGSISEAADSSLPSLPFLIAALGTLLIFIGIKADIHMLVYIFGKVKNQGLNKSHDLTQYVLVMRKLSKSDFFCHPP